MDSKEAEAQFYQLVLGLQSQAWMLLGKVANPMTGKIDKNMEAAKGTIDILRMMEVKTKGNLSSQEGELLKGAISQLEINYVAETEKKDEPEKEETTEDKN